MFMIIIIIIIVIIVAVILKAACFQRYNQYGYSINEMFLFFVFFSLIIY